MRLTTLIAAVQDELVMTSLSEEPVLEMLHAAQTIIKNRHLNNHVATLIVIRPLIIDQYPEYTNVLDNVITELRKNYASSMSTSIVTQTEIEEYNEDNNNNDEEVCSDAYGPSECDNIKLKDVVEAVNNTFIVNQFVLLSSFFGIAIGMLGIWNVLHKHLGTES